MKSQSQHVSKLNVGLRVTRSLVLAAISFLIMGGALAAGIGLGYFAYLVEDTPAPTKEELQQDIGAVTETSKLVYADSSEIAKIRSDLLRTNVASDQISDLLKNAIIATEDEYFYQHNGVVPKAVVRALLSEALGGGSSGGSTLTQQIVKQQILTNETTFKRKANEMLLAMEVEKAYSKDEIVTLYLNISPFGRNNKGQNIAGVEEAAQGIFGKSAKDVNLPQAAFIAGLPQSPIVYSPYTNTGDLKEDLTYGLQRKDFVLFSMYRNHDITKEEYDAAVKYDLTQDFKKQEVAEQNDHNFLYYTVLNEAKKIVAEQLATEDQISAKEFKDTKVKEHYTQLAEQKLVNGGYTVKSTIDKTIYRAMQDGVATYGYLLDNGGDATVEVSNILMENSTGKVLGFIAGRDYQENQFNHAFDSYRQAGSAIKPVLVYAPAIELGLVGTESRVSDYPAKWRSGENKGEEIVNATNKGSNTFETVRESIEMSNNIPAYHLYQKVLAEGKKTLVYDDYLSKMNYPESDTWQFESAPLGVSGVTNLQQTNGFQTLANDGVYQEGYIIESITDSRGNTLYQHEEKPVRVFSKATASIMNDMMRSALSSGKTTQYRQLVGNLNWDLSRADIVGKTGSTNGWADSWLVVSTPGVTLSSWSGRDDNRDNDANATNRTAQYMAYLTNHVYQSSPNVFATDKKFELSSDVKKHTVSQFTGDKPGGTVTVNNTRIKDTSGTINSLWATSGPPETSFEFGIGGSQDNYADYWRRMQQQSTPAPQQNNNSNHTNRSNNNNNRQQTTESSSTNRAANTGSTRRR